MEFLFLAVMGFSNRSSLQAVKIEYSLNLFRQLWIRRICQHFERATCDTELFGPIRGLIQLNGMICTRARCHFRKEYCLQMLSERDMARDRPRKEQRFGERDNRNENTKKTKWIFRFCSSVSYWWSNLSSMWCKWRSRGKIWAKREGHRTRKIVTFGSVTPPSVSFLMYKMASMVHYFQGCCEWRSQEIRDVKGPARSPACTTYLINRHSLSDPFPEVTLGSLVAAQKSGMGSHKHDTVVLFDDSVSVIGFLRSWAWRREDGTGHVHKRAAGEGDRNGTEMLGSGWGLSGWRVVLVCIFPSLTWQAPLASDWWGPLPPADRSPGSLFSSSLKPVGLRTLVWAVHNIWGSWDCFEQRKYLESELTPQKPGYCPCWGQPWTIYW